MKNIIIAVLITTNILTVGLGYMFVESLNDVVDEEEAGLVNTLDNFYFGFCHDAKESGYGTMESYQRLCGDQ